MLRRGITIAVFRSTHQGMNVSSAMMAANLRELGDCLRATGKAFVVLRSLPARITLARTIPMPRLRG